jgi:hypothetical protein
MLWDFHVVLGCVIEQKITFEIMFWSVAADIPMLLAFGPWADWDEVKFYKLYYYCYVLPHSLWMLFLVPARWRLLYALHIIMDVPSHTGEWSVKPLTPVLDWPVPGFYDAWRV